MSVNKRRAKRKFADLAVQLVLYNSENDSILAGPAPSFVHNISYYGACLILTKVFFQPHHLFYSPRDSEHHILCLEKNRGEKERDIVVPIKPVWFRLGEGEITGYFQMGVEFMTDPEDIDVIDLERMALATFDSGKDTLAKLANIFHL